MKTLLILAACLAAAVQAFGQPLTRKATQTEVNAGAPINAYVAPDTLANRLTLNTVLGNGSPNQQSNSVHYAATLGTNNVFSSSPNFANSNAWVSPDMTLTNGLGWFYTGIDGNWGVVGFPSVSVPGTTFARYRSTITIQSNLNGTSIVVGMTTNTSISALSANGHRMTGVAFTTTSPAFGWTWYGDATGLGTCSANGTWASSIWTNTTYNVCTFMDASNISEVIIAPGHSNEIIASVPIPQLPAFSFSNYVAIQNGGPNGAYLAAAGGRIAPQTIRPGAGVETSDFVIDGIRDSHVTQGQTAGDVLRIVLPAQADSGTNLPDLLVGVHGSGGDHESFWAPVDPENELKIRNFANYLTSNGVAMISWGGDFTTPGVIDSWGTTNANNSLETAIQAFRKISPFRNLYLIANSAGGITACDFAASHMEKVTGVIHLYASISPSNIWAMATANNIGNTFTNILKTAYGGTTQGMLATTYANGLYSGDPLGIPISAFSGISFCCIGSWGENVTYQTNQTDLLVTELGGAPALGSNALPVISCVTNTAAGCPLVWDKKVNGAGATHGGLVFSPENASFVLNFIQYCDARASNDVSNIGGDFKVGGNAAVSGVLVAAAMTNSGGYASSATNTLAVAASGLTNSTANNYMVTVTAGTGLAIKDGNGNGIIAPVLNETFPLKPGWRFTGTAVTGQAYQFP